MLIIAVVVGCVTFSAVTARAETPQGIAHYIMGLCYEFQGQPQEAALEYHSSVRKDPGAFAVQMRLGVVSSELGEHASAIKAFSAASRLQPADLQSRYLLALAYSSVRDFDRAAEQYETILKTFLDLEPKNTDFYIYLGELYFSQGKFNEGISQFEKILKIQPEDTSALLLVGSYYLEHGKRVQGVEMLKHCVAVDPVNADCLNALGYSYSEDGIKLDEAEDMIGRALLVEPENAAYLDSLGWVYYKQGKFEQALDQLNKAAAKENDPEILEHIAQVKEALQKKAP